MSTSPKVQDALALTAPGPPPEPAAMSVQQQHNDLQEQSLKVEVQDVQGDKMGKMARARIKACGNKSVYTHVDAPIVAVTQHPWRVPGAGNVKAR
jgi:hypothetical protein